MKTCRPFAADLDALAAGILPPDRVRAVQTHLAGCAACGRQYEQTIALCAELSAAGKTAEAPDAAAWRLRNRLRTALAEPVPESGRRWRTALAAAASVATCVTLVVHRTQPPTRLPDPAVGSSAAPTMPDPPLTLIACERAAARSDGALEQILSRDAARPCNPSGAEPLRAFSPASFAALDPNSRRP